MLRTALRTSIRTPVRQITYSRANYSIVGGVKETLEKANKKTGEFLASTMETAEKAAPGSMNEAADKTAEAADKVNKKTGEVLADGIDKAEKAIPNANKPADSVTHATGKVKENAKGYKDLQDKGSKAETEQARPDDGV